MMVLHPYEAICWRFAVLCIVVVDFVVMGVVKFTLNPLTCREAVTLSYWIPGPDFVTVEECEKKKAEKAARGD